MSARALTVGIVCAIGVAGCEVAPPAAPTVPTPPAQGGLERLFYVPVDKPFPSLQLPALDERHLYADLQAGPVVAYDRRTGAVAWTYAREIGAPSNLVLHEGSVLFMGAVAVALDAATGRERWTFDPGEWGSLGTAAAAGGSFYFGTDNHLFSLSVATGAVQWRVHFSEGWEFRSVVRGVVVGGDTLYASIERFHHHTGYLATAIVLALDRRTGQEIWRHTIGDGTDRHVIAFEPRVAGDLLLVADHQANTTVALDRATGAVRWIHTGDPDRYFGAWEPPLVTNDTVYSLSADSWAYALDRVTGRVLWSRKIGGSITSGALCGRYLAVQDLSLHLLDRTTGTLLATRVNVRGRQDGLLLSRFVTDGKDLFVLGNHGAYGYRCH